MEKMTISELDTHISRLAALSGQSQKAILSEILEDLEDRIAIEERSKTKSARIWSQEDLEQGIDLKN